MPDELDTGTCTSRALKLMKAEWINDYKAKLNEKMNALSTRQTMSEYDDGYNQCLDDCLALLEE